MINAGFIPTFFCRRGYSNQYLAGAGNTATDAANNSYRFAELFATFGSYCSITGTMTLVPGGYRLQTSCSNPGYLMQGAGSTLTDAANNAADFVELSLQTNRRWSVSSVSLSGAGYRVYAVSGGYFVYGYGSTLTDAAANAVALARLK